MSSLTRRSRCALSTPDRGRGDRIKAEAKTLSPETLRLMYQMVKVNADQVFPLPPMGYGPLSTPPLKKRVCPPAPSP